MIRHINLLAFFLFYLFTSSIFADNISRFYHLNIEDGLAHTDVTCVTEDSHGFIWLGTSNGLQSYDGYELKSYYFQDMYSAELIDLQKRITNLSYFNDYLLVGTKSGLKLFDLKRRAFQSFVLVCSSGNSASSNLNHDPIVDITVDANENIWIRTSNNIYVGQFDNKREKFLVYKVFEEFILGRDINKIVNIKPLCDGVMLIFRQSYLLHLQVEERAVREQCSYQIPSIDPNHKLISSTAYKSGKLYIKYPQGIIGLNVNEQSGNINVKTYKTILFNSNIKKKLAYSNVLNVDNNGNLWGNYVGGLFEIISPLSVKPTYIYHNKIRKDKYSLSTEFISDIYVGKNNAIWVSTWGGGVNFTSNQKSQFNLIANTSSRHNSINGDFVRSVDKDSDGYLWIATENYGVDKYDLIKQETVESYPMTDINLQRIQTLEVDNKRGVVYVGAMDGLMAIDMRTREVTKLIGSNNPKSERLSINKNFHVYNIELDPLGNLWIATWQSGLFVYNPDENRIIYTIDRQSDIALTSNTVTDIFYRDNNMWVTTNLGLNRILLDNNFAPLSNVIYQVDNNNPNSLSSNFISGIAVESDSVAWLSTLGGGVNRIIFNTPESASLLNHKNIQGTYKSVVYSTQNGLLSNHVEAILLDNDHNIWVSGYGISKIEYPSGNINSYDFNSGLQNNIFKIGSTHKDDNGVFYFGGVDGLNYFNPEYVYPSSDDPVLVFSDLTFFNKHDNDKSEELFVDYKNEIDINYKQNGFSLEFSALDFFGSTNILYRYKLSDYHDWTTTQRKYNIVTYNNLPYGRYDFIVMVSNDGGKTWSTETQRKLTFNVIPPWWWSNWSKALYILLILLLIVYIFNEYKKHTHLQYKLEMQEYKENKLEEHHQSRLQFFTNISHEFRTPLTIIMSIIERIQDESTTTQVFPLLDIANRNVNKLQSLITQILDFRKVESKRDNLRTSYAVFNNVVEELYQEFQIWAKRKGVELSYYANGEYKLWFDTEKVTKIIWNLISNALKYTNENGLVFVTLYQGSYQEVVTFFDSKATFESNEEMKECVILKIRDTGIGINDDSLSKIFDNYFQIESTTSLHLGSGIGLAVAKNMVLSHQGNLIVSSKKGVGSEFVVCLPLNADYLTTEQKVQGSNFNVMKFIEEEYYEEQFVNINQVGHTHEEGLNTILIVEDNIELLNLLSQYLASRYNILTASNGQEGYNLCLEKSPDVIISDIMMPVMSGLEMCAHIRNNLQKTNTPIILLTAIADVENQIEGLEAGADIYLPKPFSPRILDLQIQRLLTVRENIQEPTSDEQGEQEFICTGDISAREKIIEQKDKEFIDKLTTFVENNLDNSNYSVNSLCHDLAIGRTRLYTKTKEITGTSLGGLIRDIRITKAAELLSTTDKNITEVIYAVGIGSNSHFSKAFKMKYGVTPSNYIKGVRSKKHV